MIDICVLYRLQFLKLWLIFSKLKPQNKRCKTSHISKANTHANYFELKLFVYSNFTHKPMFHHD